MTDSPRATPNDHILRAALRAGRLIDEHGSSVDRVRTSYSLYASDALYPPSDLREGEQLLLDAGLLDLRDGVLHVTRQLDQLVMIVDTNDASSALIDKIVSAWVASPTGFPVSEEGMAEFITAHVMDSLRREQLMLRLANRYDESYQSEIGEIAEEFVEREARTRLEELGRSDLARAVQRVSLMSDTLGYDIVVPTANGPIRLEVKGSTREATECFKYNLSRNEADWGLHDKGWYLVAVSIDRSTRKARLVGHCTAERMLDHLPGNRGRGSWTAAEIALPLSSLTTGLPSLV
jgi:hypothetical protein